MHRKEKMFLNYLVQGMPQEILNIGSSVLSIIWAVAWRIIVAGIILVLPCVFGSEEVEYDEYVRKPQMKAATRTVAIWNAMLWGVIEACFYLSKLLKTEEITDSLVLTVIEIAIVTLILTFIDVRILAWREEREQEEIREKEKRRKY